MGPIDRKLYSLGYTIQEEDSNSYTYVRSLNIAGSGFGYSHKVKIVGTKRKVILQSSMIGESCDWGKECAMPISREELRLFYLKMAAFKLDKWFKRVILKRFS